MALALALVMGLAGPAQAAATRVQRDRTDNGFSFVYDAEEGEITQATSSIRLDSRDPVSFVINIRDNPDSDEAGKRLRSRLSIGLNRGHGARRYEGTFWFEITDEEGAIVYSKARQRAVVLRPKRGARSDVLRFDFDLPSGSYEATGYFEADDV